MSSGPHYWDMKLNHFKVGTKNVYIPYTDVKTDIFYFYVAHVKLLTSYEHFLALTNIFMFMNMT